MKTRSKGYFYTLDVVSGVVILVLGLVLLADLYFYAPQKVKADAISQDIMEVLAAVRLTDICANIAVCECSYPSITYYCRNGQIKNPQVSVLDFIGQLYFDNRRQAIEDIVDDLIVSRGILPQNYDLEIILYNPDNPNAVQQLYPALPTP